jgi:protein tyrosine phosphatase (PTP) superfamily phosphohydrolase (DUF442 family)
MLRWVIENKLARGPRPKRGRKCPRQVSKAVVGKWISKAKRDYGIRSIICLLDQYHLRLYEQLPVDLLSYYRASGLKVKHIPVRDRQRPPMSRHQLKKVWKAYKQLPKPVLVHCSAGIGRGWSIGPLYQATTD